VKRPYNVTSPALPARQRQAQFAAYRLKRKRDILLTIRELTPSNVPECSTHELVANLSENGYSVNVRGLAAVLSMLASQGLIKGRSLAQRNLWSLTNRGKEWLRKNPTTS